MQDTRRKRIVINLDARQTAATISRRRKRRWPKVLGVLGIIVVVVGVLAAAGVFFWWQRYKTTPAYSMAVLISSLQQPDIDTTTFDRLVDTNKIVDNLAGQVTEETLARYGTTMNPALRRRLDALMPSLLPRVKEQVREGVRFTLASEFGEIAQKSDEKPFFVLAITVPYFLNITSEGDRAKVAVTQPGRPTELTLERNSEVWQVTGVKDDALVSRIVDELARDLPTVGQPLPESPGRDPFRAPPRRKR
jgi:hypothetical protein